MDPFSFDNSVHGVIVAGGRPDSDDPLYPYTDGKAKALLRVGGRTMLERVAAALQGAPSVGDVVVVGLHEEETAGLSFARPLHVLPDQGGMVANARAGIQYLQAQRPEATEVLLSTADTPLLSPPVVQWLVEICRPFDHLAYYTVVRRETMELRFPDSRRTFVRLQGMQIAGGDLHLVQTRILDSDDELWEALTNARKHAWKLARLVGPVMLLRLLTRTLTVDAIERTAGRVFGAPIRIVITPHPEIAMDVDRPHQLEIMRAAAA